MIDLKLEHECIIADKLSTTRSTDFTILLIFAEKCEDLGGEKMANKTLQTFLHRER